MSKPLTVTALIVLAMVTSLLFWWELRGPALSLVLVGVLVFMDLLIED